jgi:L-proline amide hydrolase
MSPTVIEDTIAFHGYRTWYRVAGDAEDPGKLPVLCLHGGPGATWHHMEPYEALAEGRRVIFYDQLGCGNSAIHEPHDPTMWTTELFVEEVGAIREALGLERVHVLGHSWGGMLAMAYAITRPAGLASLVVESAPASVPFWLTELAKLRAELPADVEATLRAHEVAGTFEDPAYQEAMTVFYNKHVCRAVPWPGSFMRTIEGLAANPEVYMTMNGPSEFHVIGTIKDWDVTSQLSRIQAPTLIFCGEHDEVTPATAELVHLGIASSEFVVMEGCSHMSQAERPEETLAMLRDWLARVEGDA